MKNLKKKFMVLLAAGVMALSVSPLVLAATPQPAGNMPQDTSAQQTQQQGTAVPVTGGVSQTTLENSKYMTKTSAAIWFVIIVIANGVLSFWVGNRFYRMSKKDNHLSAEIRALRRDIEDKLVKNVGGFAEQELDIENLNESYAMDEEGIRPADKQPVLRDISEEEEERFRRWEAAQSRPRTERPSGSSVKSAVREELQEDLNDVKRINRKNYQPKRAQTESFEDEEENMDETKEIKLGGSVKSKAKEFLNDMFPFKED